MVEVFFLTRQYFFAVLNAPDVVRRPLAASGAFKWSGGKYSVEKSRTDTFMCKESVQGLLDMTHNPLHTLPRDVLSNIREYHSDRVQAHPTATLMKDVGFDRMEANNDMDGRWHPRALLVYGPLTKCMYKCSSPTCRFCPIGDWSCANARHVVRPVSARRYTTTDFID